MPIAIFDFEYRKMPPAVPVPAHYTAAQVLVRVDGHPAAWVHVPLLDGRLMASAVEEALATQAPCEFWQSVARQDIIPCDAAEPDVHLLPSATVAVCTRDRAEDLQRCLESLRQMPDEGQEILVVDSASRTGATRAVVTSFPGIRYLRLERAGLNVARNAALAAASGEIVAFIDDDAVADPQWLRAHRRAFSHPLTMASTGLTLPLELETPAQEQFEAYGGFCRGFRPRTFRCQDLHPLQAAITGAGVNMAVRRTAADLVGPFDAALDAGTPTLSGGEAEFMARLLASYFQIEYVPRALNWHRHRRTEAELRRIIYGYGVGIYAFWTRQVWRERELGAAYLAANWLLGDQLPQLVSSWVRRPAELDWQLRLDELRGCLAGPLAYLRSARAAEQERRPV